MTDAPHTPQTADRAYRVVCFDLDGTLLPQELEEFLGGYYRAIGAFMALQNVPVEPFIDSLNTGVKAMLENPGSVPNQQLYWDAFMQASAARLGAAAKPLKEWLDLFNAFYDGPFGAIGQATAPDTHMVQAVAALQAKGYPLVLTTMPLFPPRALDWRLQWAGLRPDQFLRLTTYENSTSVKPRLAYYAENLAAMGVTGADVLMVGNNTVEDLAFTQLGADAFLVTDHLLDPVNLDLNTVRHGTAADFLAWVNTLPPCQHPVETVDPGVVSGEATSAILSAYTTT